MLLSAVRDTAAATGTSNPFVGAAYDRPAAASGDRPGHMRRSAHVSQAGRRAWHVRRPWRRRLTWSSSSAPGGVSRSIASCSSSKPAPSRKRPSRQPTRETCVSTGMSCMPKANSRTHAAVLRPTPGQRAQVVAGLVDAGVRQPVERELAALGDRLQDRLDADRLHLRDAAGADRLLDLLDRRVAHRLPGLEALAQAQVGDVAVAVVRRLRQDGADQLGDRMAVRGHARDAVELGEPGPDATHAGGWDARRRQGRQDTAA